MKYDGFTFGTTLRNLRKDKQVTFEEMSGETGISVSSLKQYEQGGRQVSIKNLFILIDFFGVDVNTVLNVTDSKAEVSIDEKLMQLDKKQRDYLRKTFCIWLRMHIVWLHNLRRKTIVGTIACRSF